MCLVGRKRNFGKEVAVVATRLIEHSRRLEEKAFFTVVIFCEMPVYLAVLLFVSKAPLNQ